MANLNRNRIDADLISIVIITFLVALLLKFLICLGGWALICTIMGWTFEVPHALCIFILSFMICGTSVNTQAE